MSNAAKKPFIFQSPFSLYYMLQAYCLPQGKSSVNVTVRFNFVESAPEG
jgi:hypothetical protein